LQRVLIVEADAALRADLLRAVRAAGYQADAAADVDAARERVLATPVDAALVDVSDAGGLASLERLREAAPGLALVATGACSSVPLALEVIKRGAARFVRKPFHVGALEAALAAATRRAAPPARAPSTLLLTQDPGMTRLLELARSAAATEATLQIVGESGTGKDLLARFVHRESPRRAGPFVVVNCAALPEGVAETELFGHERGAFTGAVAARDGQVTAADGGTLVLDDVGETAPRLQPKLLRVLQEREVHPVGAAAPRAVDVRVVATSQRDLREEVAAGRFREDLYFRLDVIVLALPPLRERPGDVPLLARTFLRRFAEQGGFEEPRLPEAALARLCRHPFRGNVRELENLMRRAVVLFPGRDVDVEKLLARRVAGEGAPPASELASPTLNLRELERQAIVRSLAESNGNRTAASRALGISVRTLRNKINQYGLR
jgi:two-component system response regulator FlrC